MKKQRFLPFALIAVVAAGAASLRAFAPAQEGAPPSLKTAEHDLLAKYAGEWTGEVEVSMVPGAPPSKEQARTRTRVIAGGLWCVTDYESSLMGAPFVGHEVMGFDTVKKKYVVTWVDSMSTGLSTGEAVWDPTTLTLVAQMSGTGPDGAPMTWRQTDVWKDADSHVWTMHMAMPDGTESVAVKIHYQRKK